MKRNLLLLALTCLIWHARSFSENCNSSNEAVLFFNSLPSNAVHAQITAGGVGSSSCHAWVVTWATECMSAPVEASSVTSAPAPQPDWRTFPTKYRKPTTQPVSKKGMTLK